MHAMQSACWPFVVVIASCAPATTAAPKSTTLLLPVLLLLAVLLVSLLPLLLLLLTPLLRKLASAASFAHCCYYHQSLLPTPCLPICSFSSALPSLGLAPAVPALLWLPLTLSASRCVCESAMSHINTQAHDLTHTTQVRGVTCKSMTSPRVHASVHGVNDHVCMRV